MINKYIVGLRPRRHDSQ